jgi:hypothetical protein
MAGPYCSLTSRRLNFVGLKEPGLAVATGIWAGSDQSAAKEDMPGAATGTIMLSIIKQLK